MEIDPDEVAARRFAVALRGYDREEVARYLELVADTIRVLQAALEEAEARATRHRVGEEITHERLTAVERELARHTAHEAELSAELAAGRRKELSIDLTDSGALRRELADARVQLAEAQARLAALDPRGVATTPIGPPPHLEPVVAAPPPVDHVGPPFSFEAIRAAEEAEESSADR